MKFEPIGAHVPFEERLYDELPREYQLAELSGGAWYLEDIFGEEPETFLHADGGEEIEGNVCLNRPDDHHVFVVGGDLTVKGTLCLTVWDVTNVIVIAGDLTADAVILDSDVQLYVLGATTLSGPLICSLSDAGYAHFRGPVVASGWLNLSYGETIFKDEAPELREALDKEFEEFDELLEDLDSAAPFQ